MLFISRAVTTWPLLKKIFFTTWKKYMSSTSLCSFSFQSYSSLKDLLLKNVCRKNITRKTNGRQKFFHVFGSADYFLTTGNLLLKQRSLNLAGNQRINGYKIFTRGC